MDDGVRIDARSSCPTARRRHGGWPAVMMFHGLGGSHVGPRSPALAQTISRRDTPSSSPTRAATAPRAGSSRSTARGRSRTCAPNSSGSPRSREVSDTQIGAWGHLASAAARRGTPSSPASRSRRCETFETWSDLYGALYPAELRQVRRDLPVRAERARERIDPALRPDVPQMIGEREPPGVRQLLGDALEPPSLSAGHDAELPLPGATGLRVRHRSGRRCLPPARRTQAPLRRRLRPRAVERSPGPISRTCSTSRRAGTTASSRESRTESTRGSRSGRVRSLERARRRVRRAARCETNRRSTSRTRATLDARGKARPHVQVAEAQRSSSSARPS